MRRGTSYRRLLAFLFLACGLSTAASAAAQSYQLQPDITSIPAAAYGLTIHAGVKGDTSPVLDFSVCFFTGYGSTAPIAPTSFTPSSTGAAAATFSVPASSIQEIPPSAFANGVFLAMLYAVPLSTTLCEGWGQTPANGINFPINLPSLTSISLSSVARQNPNLTTRLPARISLQGANFINQTGANSSSPSTVVFTATDTFSGDVSYIDSADLSSSIPTQLPINSSSTTVKVCNTAVYSYCSASILLPLNALQTNKGSLTASPSSTQPQQPIGLSATFSPGKHSTAGAPSGLVTFEDAGTTLGSSSLVLDLSANYALTPPANFSTGSTLLAPLVADLNQDGVPDIIFIEPGSTGSNAPPVINILLGTSPVGQFGPDMPYNGFANNPCGKLLSAAISDFNGDGYPDLALLCQNTGTAGAVSQTVYILPDQSNGGFGPVSTSYGPVYGANLAAADFNHDGKADLVVAGAIDAGGDTGLQVLIGKGDGTFTAGPSSSGLDTAPSASFGGFQIATADLNSDGFPDIAILNGTGSSGSVDNFIQFFQNDGTGVFTKAASTVPSDGTATARFFLAPLQLGQAQSLIVISSSASKGGISAFPNLGGAQIAFSSSPQFTRENGLLQAVVGDFNLDGFLDIGVTNDKDLFVLSGDGTGVFKKTYQSLCVPYPSGLALVAAADENADGYADLITINNSAPDSTGAVTTSLIDYVVTGTASATLTVPGLASGVHRIIASTPGTPEIAGASAEATVTISGGGGTGPTTSIAASVDSPQSFGSPITLYGSVLDPAATGTLSFYSNGNLFGTAKLSTPAGAAYASGSITLNPLNAGTYSFLVVYSGDATHSTATSAILPFTINPIAPTVAWTPDKTGLSYGAPLSAGELDAVASGIAGANVPGTFTYVPALGSVLTSGTHTLSVTFTPSSTNYVTATGTATITITPVTPAVVWAPDPATIPFGTPLSTAQLNAYADTPYVASVPGTFIYTPALGTLLPVGTHTLLVAFAPTDSLNYRVTTSAASIVVGKANPVITWPAPADTVVGTVLSSTQLDATASGAGGAPLPGTFTYTPAAGTVLASGTQQLSVLFVPTDTADYNSATASVSINVAPDVLNSLLPNTGSLGDPATTVTLTGTGFLSTSMVQMNGAAVPTTFVSSKTLTAIVPAAQLKTVQAIQVTVYDPIQSMTSNALPFTVTAPSTTVNVNAPTSITPASQNTVTFLLSPYPVDVDATFTLAFQPASGLTNDPMIVFASSGKNTASAHVDAHTDVVSLPVTFESGTVAGTLTLTLTLVAGGANVTPASIQPIVIQEPFAVPGLSSVAFSQSGNLLTVVARGYSNTRAVSTAKFRFTAGPGQTVNTPDLILNVTPLFSTWYTDLDSQQYGSEFTYTETFNLDSNAAAVGQVSLTLTNDSGTSQEANTP